MKKIITAVAITPVLALFGGIGILAWRIGDTWGAGATQSLVAGLTVVCGGGALLFAILLACLVGVPLAIRAYGEGGLSRQKWPAAPALPDHIYGAPHRLPPVIDGQWQTLPMSDARGWSSAGPPMNAPRHPTPPWGVTGGGASHLLPVVEQDERFGVETDAPR